MDTPHRPRHLRTHALLALCAALATLIACSSNPEIPDQDKQRTYAYQSADSGKARSTGDTADQTGKSPTKTGAKPGVVKKKTGIPQAKGPVALVNGKPITAKEFNDEIAKIAATGQVPARYLHAMKGQLVQGLIQRKLVKKALTDAKIVVTKAEVDAKVKEVRDQLVKSTQGKMTFPAMLKRMGVTEAEFRTKMEEVAGIEKLLAARGYKKPGETEAKAYYDQNKSQFEKPEQVRASHILIKVAADADQKTQDAALAKAKELHARASAKGADFAALARAHSEGPSSTRGGDLGFFQKKTMVKPFADAAFALKDGEISKPVKTRFGWHIIKRDAHKPAGAIPFSEVKETLIARLASQSLQGTLKATLKELESKAKIELKLDNIS